MTDQPPPTLTAKQIWYCATALERFAKDYEKKEKPENASDCRTTATRLHILQTDKAPMSKDRMLEWQQRFGACVGDVGRFEILTREWLDELMSNAPDPIRTFLDAFMPMLAQARFGAAAEVIFTLHAKLNDMAEKGTDADDALNELISYLHRGQTHVEQGQPLWHDDPDLPRMIEGLQRRLMAKREQESQEPIPTPPDA